jgi:hypothetical protein
MIPAHVYEQFSKKIEYLISAIVEEMEGKVPSKQEIQVNTCISHENGEYEITWKGNKIFNATLKETSDGNIEGEWNLPEQFSKNKYIQEKVNQWNL